MNFDSSPQIQARSTVSETLQKEYILRYQRSSIGTTFSSTGFHRVITLKIIIGITMLDEEGDNDDESHLSNIWVQK